MSAMDADGKDHQSKSDQKALCVYAVPPSNSWRRRRAAGRPHVACMARNAGCLLAKSDNAIPPNAMSLARCNLCCWGADFEASVV
jgi:hypothetical protein